ncbi:UPF0041-domain-containing protein [Lindgomyces ingoldianus]|uniref:UPF0041-domain-containing protein n=1 Tax=Lindgomyces ingoldianus TaxID=673940 RepID=A0ACB6QG17_9PLEO|nr:UPF0041-domain-containing protein [Lindgomyces ingoldianus]KAF2465918.1 UPF0041-domain-containing protein [Lindgomyces ingoldianus]
MSFRPAARIFTAFRPALRFRQPLLRRRVATTAEAEQSAFARLWNSPVGPKTVHFWAPIMKWAVVLTGVSDFFRPASSLSLTQNAALMATGAIWTRWCFVIRPKNMFLAAVNFFLFVVGSTQVTRILLYQQSLKGVEGQGKMEAKEVKKEAKQVGKEVEKVVKS